MTVHCRFLYFCNSLHSFTDAQKHKVNGRDFRCCLTKWQKVPLLMVSCLFFFPLWLPISHPSRSISVSNSVERVTCYPRSFLVSTWKVLRVQCPVVFDPGCSRPSPRSGFNITFRNVVQIFKSLLSASSLYFKCVYLNKPSLDYLLLLSFFLPCSRKDQSLNWKKFVPFGSLCYIITEKFVSSYTEVFVPEP